MDVMRPQLVQIGSMWYRKNPTEDFSSDDNNDRDRDERKTMRMIEGTSI